MSIELHKRIKDLESENSFLREENEKLRKALYLPIDEPNLKQKFIAVEKENTLSEKESSLTKFSSSESKIELFMSLFRGRTDVYAKRCYSKKHENSYYIPACKNEWVRGVCDRAKTKCKDCANRDLLPLTASVIENHLRNKDENGAGIVGLYPL
jgi:hypothetical protein